MFINVLNDLRQPIGSVFEYELSEGSVRLENVEVRDLEGIATMLRTDRGLLVRISGKAVMRDICSRCLKDADCGVEFVFEEEYVPMVDPLTSTRLRAEDEDVFRIGYDYELDLREGLRQYLLMSEPLKPLCKPDCAGLCPGCGADLNAGQCGCSEGHDERWKALAPLTQNQEGN